jgi:dTDP-4-amino-4,6-dideoxygalactose transaminase
LIPFNKAALAGNELAYIAQALENMHVAGDGPFTRACNEFLEKHTGAARALLTTNCTHALEMTALLLRLEPGDEVIMPSFTFVSTANAYALRGAVPVFVDIRPDTLNIDERLIEAAITPRTKALVVVHYAGIGCEMDAITGIAARRGIPLIEDNAHGLFGRYRGRPLGSFGQLATQSFHETKNFTCGEGGALLINDTRYVEPAEIVREKGTNRARFFRGLVDKYTWVDTGSSYLPSEILAAFLLAQFEGAEHIQAERHRIWNRYAGELESWAAEKGVQLPAVPAHCEHPAHIFYLLLPDLDARTRFIAHMREAGIDAVFHYVPLHASEMGRRLSPGAHCPVTESVSDRLVRLPLFSTLSDADQTRVIQAIHRF